MQQLQALCTAWRLVLLLLLARGMLCSRHKAGAVLRSAALIQAASDFAFLESGVSGTLSGENPKPNTERPHLIRRPGGTAGVAGSAARTPPARGSRRAPRRWTFRGKMRVQFKVHHYLQ